MVVAHLDTILCLAHLLPIYRDKQAPRGAKYMDSLDIFHDFYVNKFVDHHAFEIAFWFILILLTLITYLYYLLLIVDIS